MSVDPNRPTVSLQQVTAYRRCGARGRRQAGTAGKKGGTVAKVMVAVAGRRRRHNMVMREAW